MANTIALGQAAYWPQQLSSVTLQYTIDGTLPTTDNVLSFMPPGGSPSWQYQIPFTPTSGSGTFTISGSDPRVPWSQAPLAQYTWLVVLRSGCGAVYAQATLRIVPPPSLVNLVYNGTSVTAQFTPVTAGTPTSYTLTVNASSGQQSASTSNAFQTQIVLQLSPLITGTTTFTLSTVGSGVSSASQPLPLQMSLPVVDSVSYDGNLIRARWEEVAGATQYMLRAYSTTGKPPFQVTATQNEAALTASGIDASYLFVLMASVTPNVWASIVPLSFLLSFPQVQSAVYDNAAVTAQWSAAQQATSYTMRVYSATKPEYQQQTNTTSGQLAAPGLDPSEEHFFTVQGNATGMVSATQAPMRIMLTFPLVRQGFYDGTNIIGQWQPVPAATSYTMRTWSPSGGPTYQTAVQVPQGVLPATALSPTLPYVFVIIANQAGYVSSSTPQMPVVTQIPQITSQLYDQVSVQAQWTPVTSGVGSYTLRVYATNGDSHEVTVAAGTSNAVLPLRNPLNSSISYTVQLLAERVGGIASVTQQVMLVAVPAVSGVAYDGAQVQASWIAPGSGPALTGYVIQVNSGNGGPSFVSPVLGPSSTSGTVAVANGLDPSGQYSIEIIAQAGTVSCAATPLALITELPWIQSVAYDGSQALVSWIPVVGGAQPTSGYKLSSFATQTGGTSNTTKINNSMVTTGAVPVASPGQLTYAVQVCATAGIVEACSQVLSLVQNSPQIGNVSYDGQLVRSSWNAIAGASAYSLQLLQAGGVVSEETVTATSGSIAAMLDPVQPCGIAVRAIVGASVGPAANGNVIALSPVIASLAYSASAQTLVVSWVKLVDPPAAISGFAIGLYLNGVLVSSALAVSGAASTSGTLTGLTLQSWSDYTVQVWATGRNLTGPASAVAAVIAAVPDIVGIDYDQAQVTVQWSALSSPYVRGYQVTLTPSTGNATTVSTTDTTQTLSAPAGPTYAVAVGALGSVATGPSTASVALVSEQVTIISALYDGAFLEVRWSAAQTSGASYRIELYRGADLVASQTAGSHECRFRADLAPNGNYSAKIRVVSGLASGPRSASMAVISAIPGVSSVATTASAVSVVVDTSTTSAAPGVSGYQASLYQGNALIAGPVAATTTAGVTSVTFPSTVLPQYSYSTRVQAVGATAANQAGPLSAAATVISDVPANLVTSYDGVTATVAWDAVAKPDVTGYAVVLTSSGVAASPVYTSGTSVAMAAPADKTNTIQVQAVGSAATGSATAAAAVLGAQASMTSVSFDGKVLKAAWNAAAGATGYAVSIVTDGGPVAQTVVSGTTAALAVTLDPSQGYQVSVRAIATSATSVATGPALTTAIVSASPGVAQVAASATQVVVTLNTTETSNAGAAGYQASLYAGDSVVSGPTAAVTASGVTTVTFVHAVDPQTTYHVRAWAVGSLMALQPGPPSAPAPVISAAPSLAEASYDGTNVVATWTEVSQPGVTGYAIIVADTTAGTTLTTVYTNTTAASIAATLVLQHDYTVTVQAIGNAATGPCSATADPLANSVGYFFPAVADSQYGYTFRGDIRGPGPSDILLYLPQLFATPPASITQDPFTLTKLSSPVDPSLPYTLAIPQNATINVWSIATNGIRPPLRTAYLAFLAKVEDPANGLLPGAMALLQQVIAQALPLTFAETLYYSYGYDATAGYVNLQPGMRLRVDFQNRQFVSPDPQGTLSGFIGSGTSYFPIVALAGGQAIPTIFDAFLGPMAVPVVAANTGGGAGLIDLQGSRFQQPFMRLFYPSTFPSSDSGGVLGTTQNIILAGAPTLAKIEEATTAYLKNRNFNGVTGIFWTYFRGRATFIPELACDVNGTSQFVSLGTTVRQLTSSLAPLPFGQDSTLQRLRYRRPIGNLVNQPSDVAPTCAFDRSDAVHFNFKTAANYRYPGGLDCFDMPVLGGDVLVLGD